MSLLKGKGYGNRGHLFVFRLPSGAIEVWSSNAARYEDAIVKASLPEDTHLVSSTSFQITDGIAKDFYIDNIWAIKGSIPSGKEATTFLLNKKIITEEQSTAILNAPTVRL